ncbi:MAG: nitroreductase family protein [Anaerolineales bacterium]
MSLDVNPTLNLLLNRKSVRAYAKREIETDVKAAILQATLRAPTAGNLMLYSIIEVAEQSAKETLARSCDNQPFIAKAPWVLLFLADYQRWYDYFLASGVEALCREVGVPMRRPAEGDLFLACCDALIAAQTAVIAAESLGVGSCYIGDIMEHYEIHRELFRLPRYVFPIALLCCGYPTEQQRERALTSRFDREYIVSRDRYRRLEAADLRAMFREREEQLFKKREQIGEAQNLGQWLYLRKFGADFSAEMTRSVREILRRWTERDNQEGDPA